MGPPAPPPKKGMSLAAIVLIIVVSLAVLSFGGCGICMCVTVRGADRLREQEQLDKSRARRVSVDDLLREYRTNEVHADATYKNKWIQVMGGQVDEVKRGSGDMPYVVIGTGKALEIPSVQCMLTSDQTGKAASLTKGRRVNVRGKVLGLLFNVLMTECEIL
jgi:hypothetical protein